MSVFTPASPADYLPRAASNFAYTDPTQWLPAAAREKLLRLQQRVEDRRNLCPDFDERKEVNDAKRKAESRLQQLTAHPQDFGHGLPENHPSVVIARRQLEAATGAARRIDALYKARSAELQEASAPLAAVESWLRHGRPSGTTLELVEISPPKLNKNETIVDAISRLRLRGRELRADLARITAAPFPSAHARAKIRAQIEGLAVQGAPDVSNVIEHDAAIIWPTQSVRSKVFAEQRATAFTEMPDTVALCAWLHKDALLARLDALVSEEADDAAALTVEARGQAAATVQVDLLATEHEESHFVFAGQGQDLPVEHRHDISPLALLGVRLVTVPRATTLPPTSEGLVIDILVPGGR